MTRTRVRRLTGTILAVAVLGALAGAGCGRRGARGGGWFGWAAVPACQSAVRARAFSEFGRNADIEFEGVADEKRLDKGRVRVTGRATVERKGGDVNLTYECVANTRADRLESVTYRAAD